MNEDIPTFYVKTLPGTKHFGNGGSGILYTYPDSTTEVVKLPFSSKASTTNLEIEKRVYQRLGRHPNIIRCVRTEDYGIHLERPEHNSIREYYAEGGTATLEERINWSRDVANALQYVHEHDVRHADLSGKNVLLDSSRTVRLCDFAGSAIDDNPCTVWAQSGYRHPDDDEAEHSTIRAELHALGSTVFEIITSSQSHGQVEEWIVAQWIREGKYPDIKNVALGDIIKKCWEGGFKSRRMLPRTLKIEQNRRPLQVDGVAYPTKSPSYMNGSIASVWNGWTSLIPARPEDRSPTIRVSTLLNLVKRYVLMNCSGSSHFGT